MEDAEVGATDVARAERAKQKFLVPRVELLDFQTPLSILTESEICASKLEELTD